jgi:hypothetical protein
MSTTAKQIRSKINRAGENIEEFQFRAAAFYRANPHVVVSKEDPKAGQRVWQVAVLPQIPDALASVAADAIGNLRKPLDYVATRIEYAACGVKPKHLVYFPIGRNATHYVTVRRACIQCAGKPAIDAFDAAEPYKGGKGHVLWQLDQLHKPDKHELPLAIAGSYKAFDMGPIARDGFRANFPDVDATRIPSIFIGPKDRLCPLKVGDVLFREPLEPKMQEQRKFLLDISFHEPGVVECEPVLKTLQDFADAVGGILTAFEPLLP